MRADVKGLMRGELGSWLDQQSSMRENAKEQAQDRWFWGALVLIPVLVFVWFAPDWSGTFKGIVTIVGGVAVYAWGQMPLTKAKQAIKVGINSAIARNLGIAYEPEVQPGFEFDAAKQYGLVPSHDRAEFEDRWFGQLEGHRFNLYEAHLEEKRRSGNHDRWETVFRGAIIDMSFGRNFHSTTLLQRKGKHKKWFGLGGTKDNVKFRGHQLGYVDQVHPAFDDVFEIFSDDQVEARILAHPAYIEHLLHLERAFDGKAVRALFYKGEVIIAVESGNMFESGAIDADGDERRARETAEQFAALAALAMALNQNDRGRAGPIQGPQDARDLGAPMMPGSPGSQAAPHRGFGRKGL